MKQKLYIKYLKCKSVQAENAYKAYENVFGKLKEKSKQSYYRHLRTENADNSKKKWNFMKEIAGKCRQIIDILPN